MYKCVKTRLLTGRVESIVRGSQPDLNQLEDDDPFEWDPIPTPKGPHFHPDSPRHIAAAVGSPALMPCRARNLGAKSVSWIRHRDLHVLTVNSFTFTNDERFSAHRDHVTGDWVLVLRRPQPSDSGFYECSISTKPVTALSVKLEVVVPTTELLGDGHVYLDKGSTLNLTCVVHSSPTPPEFILWYHREKLVNYGRREGRLIAVNTQHSGDTTRSSLLVYNASVWDSGNYSCKPSNSRKVFISVHVLESETPAAMQTTTSAGALGPLSHPLTFSVALGTSSGPWIPSSAESTRGKGRRLEDLDCEGHLQIGAVERLRKLAPVIRGSWFLRPRRVSRKEVLLRLQFAQRRLPNSKPEMFIELIIRFRDLCSAQYVTGNPEQEVRNIICFALAVDSGFA
ncbi:protein sidekick-2-like [Penaeus indicus]|uniref:protein sidekick-2-like n=1 Tax=Penaeus indicus TaxID=29960 RepID=UPI00300D7187